MIERPIALTGGRVTPGVVRIGDTVRRPILADRTLAHALLAHLERRAFDATPRFLGIDDQSREILSYLPGEVPADLGHYDDATLRSAAALLRRFHDVTADFPELAGTGAEVICHNDWGPPNAVFVDGVPIGIIDFDTLAPGLRLWDLGYSACSWLDLGYDAYTGEQQIHRLWLFAEAYGRDACSVETLAAFVVARQTALAASGRAKGQTALAEWAAAAADWTVVNITEKLLPTGMMPQAELPTL